MQSLTQNWQFSPVEGENVVYFDIIKRESEVLPEGNEGEEQREEVKDKVNLPLSIKGQHHTEFSGRKFHWGARNHRQSRNVRKIYPKHEEQFRIAG